MNGSAHMAVVIGASAGAVEALSSILPPLPPDFRLPVFVVVHVPPDKGSAMAELFAMKCGLAVHEAQDKEPVQERTIYFAPPDYHLLIEQDKVFSLSRDEPVHYSRPSIDVLFESAADAYGPGLIGVILTGANQDGASGLRAVAEAGGQTIVQDPSEAFAASMPAAALATCPQALVLTLAQICRYLQEAGRS